MTANTARASGRERRRVEKIKKPKRVQVWIEEETHKALKHKAIDRGVRGVSVLVEEALQLWLETEAREGSEP